ncbi:hypothetical protein CJ030_MR0G006565 [Morella rubra]|uniref:Myb/SANT-like domain-containing protein n=1 Tax=Morella rubra TaxID=262757 RepID=A0A6A1UL67_9ROSI|nr:hypothetical protein CJ030_MR0G006565 [Morella rubra]
MGYDRYTDSDVWKKLNVILIKNSTSKSIEANVAFVYHLKCMFEINMLELKSASLAHYAVRKVVEEKANVLVTRSKKMDDEERLSLKGAWPKEPSGFGWDPKTNTVTVSKEAWQKYLKKRGLENYNLLELVFNESTATEAIAHRSSEAPGNTNDEDAAIEQMEAGIHVDIAAGVGTSEEMEDCQTNEGARVSNSGIQSGATGQHGWK